MIEKAQPKPSEFGVSVRASVLVTGSEARDVTWHSSGIQDPCIFVCSGPLHRVFVVFSVARKFQHRCTEMDEDTSDASAKLTGVSEAQVNDKRTYEVTIEY